MTDDEFTDLKTSLKNTFISEDIDVLLKYTEQLREFVLDATTYPHYYASSIDDGGIKEYRTAEGQLLNFAKRARMLISPKFN